MNLLAAIASRFRRAQPQARYEGAYSSVLRTQVPASVMAARFDANGMTREALLAKSRYFERNSAHYNRVVDLFEQYVVGSGLSLFPASSSEPWNNRALAYWEAWQPFADISSRQHWTTLQGLIARAWFVDGEAFILKTVGATGNPRLQLIEAHRCRQPATLPTGAIVVDGIEVDPRGRPVAYWFETDEIVTNGAPIRSNKFTRVSAEYVIHVFEPGRIGQLRGLPFVYPVLNTLHDLDDLEAFEMKAAKAASSVEKVIKTATGEVDDADLLRGTATASDGTEKATYYKEVFAGEAKVLRHGDEIQQFGGERPSERTAAYWDYLVGKFCIGVGIPKELVTPTSMQGTSQRAMLDVSAAWFRLRASVLAQAFGQVFEYVVGYGIERDGALRGAPGDWRAFAFIPPKGPDVDAGRNSTAMIAEYKAGMRTLQSIYGESGQQWRLQLRQRADEVAFAEQLASERGITRAEVLALDPNELSSANAAGTQPNP